VKILLCLSVLILQGCISSAMIEKQNDLVQEARNDLFADLNKHNEQWGDVQQVGHRLSKKYGKAVAMRAVLKAWDETVAAPNDLACDPYFLKDEKSPHAVRLGWLVCYPERWW
jgi:hypothetical protein